MTFIHLDEISTPNEQECVQSRFHFYLYFPSWGFYWNTSNIVLLNRILSLAQSTTVTVDNLTTITDDHLCPGGFITLCQQSLLPPSLPAHCAQASLLRCLFVLELCWAFTLWLLSVLLCLSDPLQAAHQHRGAPERGHLGSLRLCSTEASVSQSAHNTTLLLLQLAALPPPSPRTACLSARQGAHTLEVRLWRGAMPKVASDQTPLTYYLCLYSLFLQAVAPQAGGPGPLGERVWRSYCKHMCLTYVWSGPGIVHILSPSGFTDKADFKLQKM